MDLFLYDDHNIVLEFISEFCFQELRKTYNEWMETPEEEIETQDRDLFWENSLDPNWDNFENFVISKENISIIFNQYQVSSYAFGIHIIDIPINEFKNLKINTILLEKLQNKLK